MTRCVPPRANTYRVPTKIYLPGSDPPVNKLGSVITCQDRYTAVPTPYQHRASPFELADKSRPEHRKIVALPLVDSALQRPSATVVPLQQKEWRVLPIATNLILKAAFGKFSPKTIDRINTFAGGFMTQTEAEAYRLELMDGRKAFMGEKDEKFMMVPFHMCMHGCD
ncbi:hypothetical protein RHS03_06324, partial [Rhizoctonia solani]